MKVVGVLLGLVVSCDAYTAPLMMATRAVTKKAPVKKVAAKKPFENPFAKKPIAATKPIAAKKPIVVKKAPAKKVVAKAKPKTVSQRSPPSSKGYPSFAEQASKFQIKGISGGPNRAPTIRILPPDFSDPKTQKVRDPEFYKAAAKTRLQKLKGVDNYVYDDGLTNLERKQRGSQDTFLTGAARSRADASLTRSDIEVEDYFGNADRFQLAFISVLGLFFLVGYLSGSVPQ